MRSLNCISIQRNGAPIKIGVTYPAGGEDQLAIGQAVEYIVLCEDYHTHTLVGQPVAKNPEPHH
ncbi:hypothetical protein N7454_002150 [Penicillium verhagenii]|nr:hypothetical protein N7454_002150 [Penicillium verhagenii]